MIAILRRVDFLVLSGSAANYYASLSCFAYSLSVGLHTLSAEHVQQSIVMPLGRGILLLWLAFQARERRMWLSLVNLAVLLQGVYHGLGIAVGDVRDPQQLQTTLVLELGIPAGLLLAQWVQMRFPVVASVWGGAGDRSERL